MNNGYTFKAPKEWGSKARKAEARTLRGSNRDAAIREGLADTEED